MVYIESESILYQTSQKVLEETAFAFVDPPLDDANECSFEGDITVYVIDFAGPFSGSLFMAMSSELPGILAGNMLGTDETGSDSDQKNDDAMGELLNIICGNVLPIIAGPREEFNLSSPKVMPVEEYKTIFENDKLQNMTVSRMIVEGGLTEVVMLIQDRSLRK